jgi:hypothetical protein
MPGYARSLMLQVLLLLFGGNGLKGKVEEAGSGCQLLLGTLGGCSRWVMSWFCVFRLSLWVTGGDGGNGERVGWLDTY